MNLPANAYNPSLTRHNGRWLSVMRHHDRGDWRTSLCLAELNENFAVQRVRPVTIPPTWKDFSHEDARLFDQGGVLKMSWTVGQWPVKLFRCVVAVGELVEKPDCWEIGSYCQPAYGNNNFGGMEKNWVPFVKNGVTWFYYLTHESSQTIIRMDGAKVAETQTGRAKRWSWGPIHGGAIAALPNGNLLHAFNSRTGGNDIRSHRYQIGFTEFCGQPPFDVLRISRRPVVWGEEGVCLDRFPYYKANVVYVCGVAMVGDEVVISYGWNDCKARLLKLTVKDLLLE